MADTTTFELVSPERLVMSKEVSMVVMPGGDGRFGVLPRHAPLISTLLAGVIEVYEGGGGGGGGEGGGVTDRIFVAGGFAEVTADHCIVLAESASRVAELDVPAAEARLTNLRDEQKNASGHEATLLTRRIADLESVLTAMKAATDT